MKPEGIGTIQDLLGDFIVFRNLQPIDARLTCDVAGTPPRKSDPAYGNVLAQLLSQARALDSDTEIGRIIFLGDTQLSDVQAFHAICQAGDWPGAAFIGRDDSSAPLLDVVQQDHRLVFTANRWSCVAQFEKRLNDVGLPVDDSTAVLVDIDKTLIGARGRNDDAIDEARLSAAERTLEDHLGSAFDPIVFRATYDRLNQPLCHPFTEDNQDFIVYACLIYSCKHAGGRAFISRAMSGEPVTFRRFLDAVHDAPSHLPSTVKTLHQQFRTRVLAGDPTPFKAFRQREFLETAQSMTVSSEPPLKAVQQRQRIFMTGEIATVLKAWKRQGALLFGLSDKPDEACFPGEGVSSTTPIHQCSMRIVSAD